MAQARMGTVALLVAHLPVLQVGLSVDELQRAYVDATTALANHKAHILTGQAGDYAHEDSVRLLALKNRAKRNLCDATGVHFTPSVTSASVAPDNPDSLSTHESRTIASSVAGDDAEDDAGAGLDAALGARGVPTPAAAVAGGAAASSSAAAAGAASSARGSGDGAGLGFGRARGSQEAASSSAAAAALPRLLPRDAVEAHKVAVLHPALKRPLPPATHRLPWNVEQYTEYLMGGGKCSHTLYAAGLLLTNHLAIALAGQTGLLYPGNTLLNLNLTFYTDRTIIHRSFSIHKDQATVLPQALALQKILQDMYATALQNMKLQKPDNITEIAARASIVAYLSILDGVRLYISREVWPHSEVE